MWVQVPLKSARDLCDDVVETSTDLNDSSEALEHPPASQDTWHWWRVCSLSLPCIHRVSKRTSHLWLAITLTHMNGFWYFFGRNVADNVGNQKTLYFTMPPQIISASVLPGKTGKHENHIFNSIGLCYTHNAPVHCLSEKNCHLWCVW